MKDSKNLCIDWGNTKTKVGLFDSSGLIKVWEYVKSPFKKIESLLETYKIQYSILSTSGEPDSGLIHLLNTRTQHIHFGRDLKLPIINLYKTPESLGQDRLAAVIGAYMLYPGKSHLIIDAGTCITYDYIDQKGNYMGGNISPGVQMRLNAIHAFTHKLPKVSKSIAEDWFLGYSTETAIQNGVIGGTILEIESFINWMFTKDPGVNIFLTGGDAKFLIKKMKIKIFVLPHLILLGLNEILKLNA